MFEIDRGKMYLLVSSIDARTRIAGGLCSQIQIEVVFNLQAERRRSFTFREGFHARLVLFVPDT